MARRRGNGEGSIFPTANGSWRAMISLDGKRLSFTAKTRQEAHAWIKKTIGQVDDGLTYKSANIDLAEHLSGWLVSMKGSIRPGTWYQYELTCRVYILPRLGSVKLKDLGPGHLQDLYNYNILIGKGMRTIKLIHVVLHQALQRALDLGLIVRNPADIVKAPKYQHGEMKIFDESQVNRMLFAARGDHNEALFVLAVTTGCRQSELLALRWSDLDWQKKTIRIQRQLARNNRQAGYYVPLKTKSAYRTIDLGQKTISKLREHYERQHQERVSVKKWEENDLIFPSSRGTPQDQFNIYHKFKTLIKTAGLPEIRFHDLRHTAASLMIDHKVPINVVSKRLGHSRVSITLDTYTHLISEVQSGVAELIDSLVMPVEIELHPNCTQVPDLQNIHTKVSPYMEKSP